MNDQGKSLDHQEIEVILGNSNKRFSGVTSTMLQTLPHLSRLLSFRVMGKHHLPDPTLAISFRETIKLCQQPLSSGKPRVFHARRNDEMIQALLLRDVFSCHLKILFTSTAQRRHSGFTRWLMSKMDTVISTCEAAAGYLLNRPTAIIPHGVDTQRFQPSNDRSEEFQALNIPGSFAIGIFGRVRAQKGVDLFVRGCIASFPQQPEVSAIIVGAIASKNERFVAELEHLIEHAGLQDRILFWGERPFDELPRLFRAVSLVAALSHNEGFGLTVLEAMSSGSAVLATNAGAWDEIIRPGIEGEVIPSGDQRAVNDALEKMLAHPEQLKSQGENGRRRILQHYTIDHEVEQLVKLYRSLQ